MGTDERPLAGGVQTSGIVRVGDSVRRPRHERSQYVQDLLGHLEQAGFRGAPRPLGFDEQNREVVSYVEGVVPHGLPHRLSDGRIRTATHLIREFHDASATWSGRGDAEVVCHGDLGPHNTVFRGETAVALIDWDAETGPGSRLVDFAHAVWCFADLTESAVPIEEQVRKTRLMCDAYPGMTPVLVVDELTARFRRARVAHRGAGRTAAVEIFDGLLAWMHAHGARIADHDGRS